MSKLRKYIRGLVPGIGALIRCFAALLKQIEQVIYFKVCNLEGNEFKILARGLLG